MISHRVIFCLFAAGMVASARSQSCLPGLSGILSYSKLACCPFSCGKCGGTGCGTRPGGAENCCEGNIVKNQPRCAGGQQSPCKIPTSSFPDRYFNIKLVPAADTERKYDSYFKAAKERWEQVITGDIMDIPGMYMPKPDWFLGLLDDESRDNEMVDDIVIGYKISFIDGPNKVLGRSGPLQYRAGGNYRNINQEGMPISGIMQFDSADVEEFVKKGKFGSIVLHEMGHVLGLGTMWPTNANGCGASSCSQTGGCSVPTCSTYNFAATGICHASRKFKELGFTGDLELEQRGGSGTACTHWSKYQLGPELMTGYLSEEFIPLSAVTVGALQDLGYEVSYALADAIQPSNTTVIVQASDSMSFYDTYGGIFLETNPVPFTMDN